MPQKIYDIKPPEEKDKKSETNHNSKKRGGLFLGGIFTFILLILGVVYFFTFHVEVEIWPETYGVEVKDEFSVDASDESSSNGVLKGKIFETDFFEEYREFKTTGMQDSASYAEGTVIIKNRQWDQNQPLLQGTRFESSDGKIFKAKDGILVPGRKYQAGEIIPGEVEVEVEAIEPGPDYNVKPTEFTLPGLQGSAAYQTVTAVSEEEMIGGARGETTTISEGDIDRAKEEILQALLEEGKEVLQAEKAEQFLLEDVSHYDHIIEEEVINGRVGEAKENFSVKIRAKITALTFPKEDFNKLLKDRLLDNYESEEESGLAGEVKVYQPSVSYNYNLDNVNWDNGRADLLIEFAGEVYHQIDETEMMDMAEGKDRKELARLLQAETFIKNTEVRFNPFGFGSIPENRDRIKTLISF